MKLSWKWLNQTIALENIPLDNIIDKLTLAGFEIEEIQEENSINDKTIDIDITANRADTSNIIGLAREINSVFNIKLIHHNYIYQAKHNHKYKYTTLNYWENNKFAIRPLLDIQFTTIKNLKQQISPTWLQELLHGCEIQSENILQDIIKYVNTKWGQDIEIFDLNKVIKNSKKESIIEITQKINFHLYNEFSSLFNNLNIINDVNLIKYQSKILSIVGLESNNQFYCDRETSAIIIMSKICNPQYISHITSKNNIRTDISNKHLKGIPRENFTCAYNEAINLILDLTSGEINNIFTYKTIQKKNLIIQIPQDYIKKILGTHNKKQDISKEKITQILKQLKFRPKYIKDTLQVIIPENRSRDITRPIDVIEEIARIYGFNSFYNNLPTSNNIGYTSEITKFIRKIRRILRNLGIHEIIHYSLENKKYCLDISEKISLYNPLLEDQSILRSNLVKDLINANRYNYKQKNLPFECFEIGKIFQKSHNNTIEEIGISGILGNPYFSKNMWSEKAGSMNWFQAKGFMEDFFDKLGVNAQWKQAQVSDQYTIHKELQRFCHPYRTAIISDKYNHKNIIGIFFQTSNKLKDEISNDYNTYIFEINPINLIKATNKKQHLDYNFINYSTYPSVTRDISLILNQNQSTDEIKEYILFQKNPFIESVEVFNEYKEKYTSSAKTNRSVGFRITYRAKTRTLNNKDIKNIEADISNLLKKLQIFS